MKIQRITTEKIRAYPDDAKTIRQAAKTLGISGAEALHKILEGYELDR